MRDYGQSRVGYISADFKEHSASHVFMPVLEGHDRSQVEITCYWQQESDADEITARIEALADLRRRRGADEGGDRAVLPRRGA